MELVSIQMGRGEAGLGPNIDWTVASNFDQQRWAEKLQKELVKFPFFIKSNLVLIGKIA